MIRKIDAILSLRPKAEVTVSGTKVIWLDSNQTEPSEVEIQQEIARLEYLEEINEYQRLRAAAYPSMADQLDKIYHEGIDAWKSSIKQIKDQFPKAESDSSEIEARKSKVQFDIQLKEYQEASSRLSNHILSEGRPESRTMVPSGKQSFNETTMEWEDSFVEVVTEAIDPLPATVEVTELRDPEDPMAGTVAKTIRNPAIVKDEEERAAAQAIIDATPEEVKAAA